MQRVSRYRDRNQLMRSLALALDLSSWLSSIITSPTIFSLHPLHWCPRLILGGSHSRTPEVVNQDFILAITWGWIQPSYFHLHHPDWRLDPAIHPILHATRQPHWRSLRPLVARDKGNVILETSQTVMRAEVYPIPDILVRSNYPKHALHPCTNIKTYSIVVYIELRTWLIEYMTCPNPSNANL